MKIKKLIDKEPEIISAFVLLKREENLNKNIRFLESLKEMKTPT